MADVGNLVTDDEVLGYITGAEVIDARLAFLIRGGESRIDKYLQRTLKETVYVDEPVRVGREITWQNMVILPKIKLFVARNLPITTWTALKIVQTYDSNGVPNQTTTIDRDRYYVDLDTGWVTLQSNIFDTNLLELFDAQTSTSSFPPGPARILASYTGGYTKANVPADIKLALVMRIDRALALQKRGPALISVQSEFVTENLIRADFSPEEMGYLDPYKIPVV